MKRDRVWVITQDDDGRATNYGPGDLIRFYPHTKTPFAPFEILLDDNGTYDTAGVIIPAGVKDTIFTEPNND